MDVKTRLKDDLRPRGKHYEPDVKLRILHMYERGNIPVEDIAESFGITKQAIYTWRRSYKKNGVEGLKEAPRSGRPPFISKKHFKKCIDKVRDGGLVTVKKLRKEISKKYGILLTNNHVWRLLDCEGQNYKKTNPVHARAATNEEIEAWCRENIPGIDHYVSKGHTLLASDEVHPEMDGVVRYGYAEGSQRIYATHHGNKRRINIIGAISGSGQSIFRTQRRSNSATFKAFLEAVLEKFGKVIIMTDRASYHTSKAVREWFDGHPKVVPIYMPVGSPHMNGIENNWGMAHAYLRGIEYYTFGEFKHHIFYFLRRRKFKIDIYGKLNSRLDPNAEAQIIRARKQLGMPKNIADTAC